MYHTDRPVKKTKVPAAGYSRHLSRTRPALVGRIGTALLTDGYIYQDTWDVIPLTRRRLPLSQALVDELAQLSQQVRPKQGATSAGSDYEVDLENVGPLHGKRAKPPIGPRIRHAISAPVVAHGEQIERLPSQRMEGMDDRENLRAVLVTICNARSTPTPRPRAS